MQYVIETRELTKYYDDGVRVPALRGIDLRIQPGAFVAIMGPSGSGKSTLLNILGCMESPSEGKLLLEGTDVSSLSDNQRTLLRRRRIGFVFQQFNLLPVFSAVENVAMPLRLDGKSVADARRRATEMLGVVGLAERCDHLPSQLSGGEQQRVAIARALIIGPSMILADEPTGNLDSASAERIITMLRNLVDEQRQTVVMVTHDASMAARADRVVRLRDGLIIDDIDPRNGTMPADGACAPEKGA
jgi:ABC-type lipoprotein export system ATPase subunit